MTNVINTAVIKTNPIIVTALILCALSSCPHPHTYTIRTHTTYYVYVGTLSDSQALRLEPGSPADSVKRDQTAILCQRRLGTDRSVRSDNLCYHVGGNTRYRF